MSSPWKIRVIRAARMAFMAAGAKVVPVPVDEEGLIVEKLPVNGQRDLRDTVASVSDGRGHVAASSSRVAGLCQCP